ncbi:MAG: hypothetical protein ACFFF9_10285 [Candidatus Thorarchaeota archaeon]
MIEDEFEESVLRYCTTFRRPRQFPRNLIIPITLLCLTLTITLIQPVSGTLYPGKTAYYEYYHSSGDWATYVKFEVDVWSPTDGIAVIKVTNNSAIQEYRLRIPEWAVVDTEGNIVERWPYCPIWLDVSAFESGMVFTDPDSWLFNFSVNYVSFDMVAINRTTPDVGFIISENLFYDSQTNRIRQYDYHTRYPNSTVYTIQLMYYPGEVEFTITDQGLNDSNIPVSYLFGFLVEIVVIVYLIAYRFRE